VPEGRVKVRMTWYWTVQYTCGYMQQPRCPLGRVTNAHAVCTRSTLQATALRFAGAMAKQIWRCQMGYIINFHLPTQLHVMHTKTLLQSTTMLACYQCSPPERLLRTPRQSSCPTTALRIRPLPCLALCHCDLASPAEAANIPSCWRSDAWQQ
jgi:hypothetical protein